MNKSIHERKSYTVFSQEVAAKLMLQGFVLIRTERNKNESGKNVFHFSNSPEFQKALRELTPKK